MGYPVEFVQFPQEHGQLSVKEEEEEAKEQMAAVTEAPVNSEAEEEGEDEEQKEEEEANSTPKKGAAAPEKATSSKRGTQEMAELEPRGWPKKAKVKEEPDEEEEAPAEEEAEIEGEPSDEVLEAAAVEILMGVDIQTFNLKALLTQLGKKFGMDLLHRKSCVKRVAVAFVQKKTAEEGEQPAPHEGRRRPR